MEFKDWLKKEKKYSDRSARDVKSRIKRALIISGEEKITEKTLPIIESNNIFCALSPSVKSQIRRAVHLYQEYSKKKLVINL